MDWVKFLVSAIVGLVSLLTLIYCLCFSVLVFCHPELTNLMFFSGCCS